MEESRKQFEAWFSPRKIAMQKRGISTIRIVRLHKKMLEAWQASRAAIEIELPEIAWDITECGSQHYDVEDVKDSIRAAGLTVKGDR